MTNCEAIFVLFDQKDGKLSHKGHFGSETEDQASNLLFLFIRSVYTNCVEGGGVNQKGRPGYLRYQKLFSLLLGSSV